MQEDFAMTTDAKARKDNSKEAGARSKGFRLVLLITVLFLIAVSMFVFGRSIFSPPKLQPEDVFLLAPESIARVEAAAKGGDIVAQSIFGSAYLDGKGDVPKNVTKAVFWLRRVGDRDPSEFYAMSNRMNTLLEKRRQESDPRKRIKIDLEYLDFVTKKLAYETAVLGLIDVYLGRHGASHANTALGVACMQLGSTYGFPSAQRALGIVTEFGLFGVPKDEIAGRTWLSEAARNGDQVAEDLLVDMRAYDHAMLHAKIDSDYSGSLFG
jgi:TPR repeat protein